MSVTPYIQEVYLRDSKGNQKRCVVRLEVDWVALYKSLGAKALRNKSLKTRFVNGIIKAQVKVLS